MSDESSICQANRGRTKGIDSRDGGNLIYSAVLDGDAGKDPNNIHDTVKRGQFFQPDQVPLMPYLEGKRCSVTNWTTMTTFLNAKGVQTLCHMPVPAWKSPTDTCIIFKITDSCTAISCNFPLRKNVFGNDLSLQDVFIPDESNNQTNDSTLCRVLGATATLVILVVGVKLGLVAGNALMLFVAMTALFMATMICCQIDTNMPDLSDIL